MITTHLNEPELIADHGGSKHRSLNHDEQETVPGEGPGKRAFSSREEKKKKKTVSVFREP